MQFINDLQTKAVSLVKDNASALLTAGGVVGTVATAVLTARATFKAAEIIREEELRHVHPEGVENSIDQKTMGLSQTDKVKLVWPLYVLPAASGTTTIAFTVMANRISAQKAAALAAAYGVSQKHLEEYKTKVQEKLGVKKATDLQDSVQQDRLDKKPIDQSTIVVTAGPVLCYDAFSDRYFRNTADAINKAANVVTGEIENHNECSLRTFYDELELPHTMYDDMLGWNLRHPFKMVMSAMMVNDNEACLCIDFHELPVPNYGDDY